MVHHRTEGCLFSHLEGEKVADYPAVIEQFNRSVVCYADCPAVMLPSNQAMTYREFGQQVDQMVSFFVERGLLPQQIVAVKCPRSVDLMVVVFALFKARLVYLPIDPDCPRHRQAIILEDAQASLLMTTEVDVGLPSSVPQCVISDGCTTARAVTMDGEPQASDLAYIIYTSGSTGQPKGVMVGHAALANRLHWMQKCFALSKGDVVLHKTPIGFDVSIWELFWWCYAGACVLPYPSGEEHNVFLMYQYVYQYHVTVMHFVPSVLDLFLDYLGASHKRKPLSRLQRVFCSGEALQVNTVHTFYTSPGLTDQVELINLYGPTEATIDVSYYSCPRNHCLASMPIGLPIDNTEMFVVGEYLQQLPRGQVGQLCIAGVALAKGYTNLRHQQPTGFSHLDSGKNIYQTGDRAMIKEDGLIYYLGRIDRQIKLHGLRIELSEIEYCLQQMPHIRRAVVIFDEQRSQCLHAYIKVKPSQDNALRVTDIERFLVQRLPRYMLPRGYLEVDNFPLKKNGKLDLSALKLSAREVVDVC